MDDKDRKASDLNEHIMHIVKNEQPKTVEQLVELVHQEHPLPQQEIIEHILDLQNQGKLAFNEDTTFLPLTLKGYLSSSHSYWYWTIITLALTTTASVFTIPENAYPLIYARYVLGSIFVLFLPGYSLIKALFPTRELDNIERLALSIGMSLALVPITGLLLNYTPWGIRTTPVTLSLLALTAAFATAAIIREHQAKLKRKPRWF
jgi:hypothetical protein